MGFDIASILGGTLIDSIKGIIGSFKVDPTKKAELQAIVDANAHEIRIKESEFQTKLLEVQTKEVELASLNIRAEAQSGDKYTSRARPTFIYMMIAIMAANYILFPSVGRQPISFPEALFWLFGSCMLGYTGARSWEKRSSEKK